MAVRVESQEIPKGLDGNDGARDCILLRDNGLENLPYVRAEGAHPTDIQMPKSPYLPMVAHQTKPIALQRIRPWRSNPEDLRDQRGFLHDLKHQICNLHHVDQRSILHAPCNKNSEGESAMMNYLKAFLLFIAIQL